ncbi:MAG: peptide deformylase [candidate division WOR-3 bacterium]
MTIIKYPDKVLRQKTSPVDKITKEIFDLSEAMIQTMLENDGIGLAANQIGSLHRLFVLNLKPLEDTPEPVVIINPQIIKTEGPSEDEEGCLSFPGLYLHIPRFKRIVLHYQNLYNEKIVIEANGLVSRAIQHEYDHLNGILFIDHVNEQEKEKLDAYLANLKAE